MSSIDFSDLHFNEAPKIVITPPGNKSKKLLSVIDKFESNARTYAQTFPIALKEGKGATLKDVDDNIYIDFLGGAGSLNAGHTNSFIQSRVDEQSKKLILCFDITTPARVDFMEKFSRYLPDGLRENYRIQFCSPAGTDAVEAALKLAQYYTKSTSVFAFKNSYHGMTSGSMSWSDNIDSIPTSSLGKFNSSKSEVHFFPFPHSYRCPSEKTVEEYSLDIASMIESKLSAAESDRPRAILIEPIQGEGGTIIPPDIFLKRIREIATKYDIPLILDEIQTGIYRTGKMFAFEHCGIVPDIFTVSKSISGIGYPLAFIVYHKKFDRWPKGAHAGTFRANQLSLVAASATLDFFEESNIEEHISKLNKVMVNFLYTHIADNKHVGEIREKGLMFGLEIVEEKERKVPSPKIASKIREKCFKNGLILEIGGHHSNVIRLLPPLVITEDLALKGLEVLRHSVSSIESNSTT